MNPTFVLSEKIRTPIDEAEESGAGVIGAQPDYRSNSIAIGARAHRLDLEPVRLGASVVSVKDRLVTVVPALYPLK